MKRTLAIIMVLVLSFGIVGCGNKEKQEALLQYLNEDRDELIELETSLLESYNSVTGDNYNSDAETLSELSDNTLSYARKLNDEAVKLSTEISDEEIQGAHRLYMDYSNKMLNAIGLMIAAIENEDRTQVVEANEKLNEANNLALDYQQALKDLGEKYKVGILK